MAHDQKLVDAVMPAAVTAIKLALPLSVFSRLTTDEVADVARRVTSDVLDALNASGIAFVAPWQLTNAMHKAHNVSYMNSAGAHWASLRNACLTERRGDAE